MDKCEICRNSCKGIAKEECKFYPKECFIGESVHFAEDPNRHYGKHESTSRMCVVCKTYFSSVNIKWWKGIKSMFPFCLECWKRHVWVLNNVEIRAQI